MTNLSDLFPYFTRPNQLLLWHLFDGDSGDTLHGTKPDFCYDRTTTFDCSTGTRPGLNGSGYLVEQSTGARAVGIDPGTNWPSKTGKERNYMLWGRTTADPTAGDQQPTFRINQVDPNNFWSTRVDGGTANRAKLAMYEWISGGVGEGVRTATNGFTTSGAYGWQMHIRDMGDTVLAHFTCHDESAEASDLTIVQSDSIQLYKASRPNQDETNFSINWEGVREIVQIRGLAVWDEG